MKPMSKTELEELDRWFHKMTLRVMDTAEQCPEAFRASVEKSRKEAAEYAARRQRSGRR